MEQPQSRYSLNILSQLVLALVFSGLAISLQNPVGELCMTVATVLYWLFGFGLFYGLFRLVGLHVGILEALYQNVPVGFWMHVSGDPIPQPSTAKEREWSLSWEQFCSFKTLRYAGILLIVSALFSLLFNIDWDLGKKIVACVAVAVLSLGAAEWFRKNKKGFAASLSSLISFALAQFALTLLFMYATENQWPDMWTSPHTWLTLKLLLTCVSLFMLWRYPSDVQSLLTFSIAYAGPLTMLYAGASISFPVGLVYLALMTAIVLTYSCMHVQPAVWILNVAATFGYIYILWQSELSFGRDATAVSVVALMAYAAFYVAHVVMASSSVAHRGKPQGWLELLHMVFLHCVAALAVFSLQYNLWLAGEYAGAGIFLLGMGSFAASMATRRKVQSAAWHELTVNLAIIFSAAGLFIQVKGPWSAVGFLFYACAVLWFSLYQNSMRTRVYGFLILIVSMVKLYLQFSDIFNSVPGSVAILVIGGLLVMLSYKFEDLSRIMRQGLPHTHA